MRQNRPIFLKGGTHHANHHVITLSRLQASKRLLTSLPFFGAEAPHTLISHSMYHPLPAGSDSPLLPFVSAMALLPARRRVG